MKVEIQLDPTCQQPKAILVTDQLTEEIQALAQRLTENDSFLLSGFQDDLLYILEQHTILRIYTQDGKVFAHTNQGIYRLRYRIYELEERLDPSIFVRISSGEIINLKKASRFDLSLTGTILVSLTDGTSCYVSRRYLSKIRKRLGI